jgi:hypothetical protein
MRATDGLGHVRHGFCIIDGVVSYRPGHILLHYGERHRAIHGRPIHLHQIRFREIALDGRDSIEESN